MRLQARRLVARCLADHHGLDEIPHEWHQSLFDVLTAIVAGEVEELAVAISVLAVTVDPIFLLIR